MKNAQDSVSYIISVLKEERPTFEPNWYEVTGFLFCHKIAGLFYGRAKSIGITIPKKIDFLLYDVFERQARSVACKRKYIQEISEKLSQFDAEYVFLKGSVLANIPLAGKRIYADGERVSNDIDILVQPSGITPIGNALREAGFVQGRYDRNSREIVEFSRTEILKRRMTRGEVAPFVKLTNDVEFPFIEADINFSLGNTPADGQELLKAIVGSAQYRNGEISMFTPADEMLFAHLIMHQYKESCLYFMVQRSKELDVYKLADIYYMLKNKVINVDEINEIVYKYDIADCVGAVLKQVGDVFDDVQIQCAAERYGATQPLVIDYENKKKYEWKADISERIRTFSAIDLLREVS